MEEVEPDPTVSIEDRRRKAKMAARVLRPDKRTYAEKQAAGSRDSLGIDAPKAPRVIRFLRSGLHPSVINALGAMASSKKRRSSPPEGVPKRFAKSARPPPKPEYLLRL